MSVTKKTSMAERATLPVGYADIRSGIVGLLDAARQAATRSVNALMTASYWEIGRRIVEAEQKGKRRAGYGEQLIERLASDLTQRFGRGFSRQNLQQMRSFFLTWPIRQTVSGESSSMPLQGRAEMAQACPRQLDELAQMFTLPWSAADKGQALARYALDGLPTKVMAANYRTVLPDAEMLQKELENTRRMLESRSEIRLEARRPKHEFRASALSRRARME
jgi:hypothetical protein